jgi:hypothetical protein
MDELSFLMSWRDIRNDKQNDLSNSYVVTKRPKQQLDDSLTVRR